MITPLTDKDLLCTECKGEGETECDCCCPNCEAVVHCDWCDGTGLNEEYVNVEQWQEAVAGLDDTLLDSPSRALKKAGVYIGQRKLGSMEPLLLIKDFLLPEAAGRYKAP